MTRMVPITPEGFAGKAWRRAPDYRFAAQEPMALLSGADLAQAPLTAPLAFVPVGERIAPVMLMSPAPGRNLFVGPKGEWLGGYVPTDLRAYPFRLITRPDGENADLYFDEDSGLAVEAGTAGAEPFYDEAGQISASVQATLRFLAEVETGRRVLAGMSAAISGAGLIQPWAMTIKSDDGEQVVNGLFRIDERALQSLDDEAFLALRPAMPLVYAHLLSTAQFAVFSRLIDLQASIKRSTTAPPAPEAPAFRVREEDGILHFE